MFRLLTGLYPCFVISVFCYIHVSVTHQVISVFPYHPGLCPCFRIFPNADMDYGSFDEHMGSARQSPIAAKVAERKRGV